VSETAILASWRTNAAAWTTAVREAQIESRRLATDRAIVDAVTSRAPRTLLDVGCGEGWLARALAPAGIEVTGVDVTVELIERARELGGGRFETLSYEQLAAGALAQTFDALVCNFSLLGDEPVAALLRAVPRMLTSSGALIIQTLHPLVACGEGRYEDGWRTGSWAGFAPAFTDPPPWYFRTLPSWLALLAHSGLDLVELKEPLHPTTGKPASLILIAQPAAK